METTLSPLSAEDADTIDLGVAMGQQHAFGLIAGRSAAAQAAALKRLREEKKYKRFTAHWSEFCPEFLKMSSSHADRIIRLLDEFGPVYFEVAQLTRISAETYRAIEPSIKDGALHSNGETIALEPRNAQKVAQAISELRAALPVAKPSAKKRPRTRETPERLAEMDHRCATIVAELREISSQERNGKHFPLFTSTLTRVCAQLNQLKRENGLA